MMTVGSFLKVLPQVASRCTRVRQYVTNTTENRFLKDRVALVTGSTSGIGLAIAESLASQDCSVILNGFGDVETIASIKDKFTARYKGRVDHKDADLTDIKQIEKMCSEIREVHPAGVDILVNNAGFQFVCATERFPVEKWDSMIAVLLSAPFHLTRLLLPDMKTRGWGRIINVSSAHGLVASPNKVPYVAAKHGLIGMSKAVALETAGLGITCNALCPGYVDTPILQEQIRTLSEKDGISYVDAEAKFLSNFHATKTAVGTHQLGEAVLFMCSDAASQMTGTTLVIDGGWTAK